MDEGFEKGTMKLEKKKKKIPATWETKPEAGEKMLKKEREKKWGVRQTDPPSSLFCSQFRVLWVSGGHFWSREEWQREKQGQKKKEKEKDRKRVRAHFKEGEEWQGGGMEGEQLESLSSAPSHWIGLMNASECWGATTSSIKAGNTAQI